MSARLVVGMKVRYRPQAEWGVGHLEALEEEGGKARVLFPAREGEAVWVSTKGQALIGEALVPGTPIRDSRGRPGIITAEEEGGRGLRRYVLRYEDGTEDELPESEVRCTPPRPDLISLLREGRVGDPQSFLLRRQALRLDEERRGDALGALFASRVMVKPHQVGVVQRVLAAPRPRFVLADEVGLGKTIEAGMVFSALRLAGLARRVLVVAPSHLTVQWLVELSHKFHHLFAMMDGERASALRAESPELNPWARFELVVTSLELLQRSEEQRAAVSAPEAAWDLVIVDEAHHLKGKRAFEAAQALAKNTWGLLLLTATPMQLDPEEYHGLLTLIDAESAPSREGFVERLARQEELSGAVRALEAGDDVQAALTTLRARFPGDARLAALEDRDAALAHLAETYSLSERLLRNRRAVVGGFSRRVLRRHPVQVTTAESEARDAALAAVASGSLKGEVRSRLVRRLESSPAAFLASVRSTEALAPLAHQLRLPERDGKFNAFLSMLQDVWGREPAAKVLVFTEAKETLEWLQTQLARENLEALGYHGELSLVDRDRQVARFRDPEGPRVLICTEVGGEGRNFQFAHHLVCYDLPWSPATMEQRIGRLDRIGQTRDVEIHVFDAPGTFSAEVLALLADAVGVFGETVGGLDAVLEEVEENLARLALSPAAERAAYRRELSTRVIEARAQVARAYDPLLDARSLDRPAVEALVSRAESRLELELEEAEDETLGLEDRLHAVARDLDERLEETVTDIARRVGLGVDTDEQVDAFQCAFHFGHALKVDALPGLDLSEERTVLGSFWRDTAVEQEELEYFATGHPLVEALFGFLRDGPFGRSAFRYLEKKGPGRVRGLELLFHLVPKEPADTSPGARVPSRQLSRYLERSLIHVAVVQTPTGPRVEPSVLPTLEREGQGLKGDEIRAVFPEIAGFVDPALAAGQQAAEAELERVSRRARAAIELDRDAALERLTLAGAHQGLSDAALETHLQAARDHATALLEALRGVSVQLDSACGFAINR